MDNDHTLEEDKKLFQIPAEMSSYKSKANGTVQFTFVTQELITPENLYKMLVNLNKVGNLLFAVEELEFSDLGDLPKIDKSMYGDAKTPAQRLRAVLWLYFKQKGGKSENFQLFYDNMMEKQITTYKEKLDD